MLPHATFQNSLELPKNITRSKKNITRFQILGFLNSLRPFTPMLSQASLQNSLKFCEFHKNFVKFLGDLKKKKSLHSSDPKFSRNFLGHL